MGQKGERGNDAQIPQSSILPPAGPPGPPGLSGFDGMQRISFVYFLQSKLCLALWRAQVTPIKLRTCVVCVQNI